MKPESFFPQVKIIILFQHYPKLYTFLYDLKTLSREFVNCDFVNNICRMNKLNGCCVTCMNMLGFYKYDSFLLAEPKHIMGLFNFDRDMNSHRYGFLNVGYGCSLPRWMRSNPCIVNVCMTEPHMHINQKKIVLAYNDIINHINKLFLDIHLTEEDDILEYIIKTDSENFNKILMNYGNKYQRIRKIVSWYI